jgi:ribonuclease R
VCDESGRIEKIVPRTRNDAHRLIEEAMLAANVCSAEFIAQSKHLGLFRVHEGPTPEKLETLRQYLKALGVPQTVGDAPRPMDFQHIAHATEGRPDVAQIHQMLLRSMQQAIYSPSNGGHFGLAFEAYTHFTSPIRRYPDLLVHRVIKAILQDRKYHLPALPTPGEAQAKLSKRLSSRVRPRQTTPPPPEPSRRPKCWAGRRRGCIAAPTSAAPTRPAAMSRPGSSASTCASTWARSFRAWSARPPVLACLSRSTACMSKGWCTSPNWGGVLPV